MYSRKLLKKELKKSFKNGMFLETESLRPIGVGSSRRVFSFRDFYAIKVPRKLHISHPMLVAEDTFKGLERDPVGRIQRENPFLKFEHAITHINGINQSREEIEFFEQYGKEEAFKAAFTPIEDSFCFKGLPIIVMKKYHVVSDMDISYDSLCEVYDEVEGKVQSFFGEIDSDQHIGDIHEDNIAVSERGEYLLCDYGLSTNSKFSLI